MCGRFVSAIKPSDIWLGLMQEWSEGFFDRYNVSPASQIGGFAGLWDECSFGDASLKSCTIITTESETQLKELHTRMPVILSVDAAKHWLGTDTDKDFLLSENLTDFAVFKVDRRVNDSTQEDKALIAPI